MFSEEIKQQPEHKKMTVIFDDMFDKALQGVALMHKNQDGSKDGRIKFKQNQMHRLNIKALKLVTPFMTREAKRRVKETIMNLEWRLTQ